MNSSDTCKTDQVPNQPKTPARAFRPPPELWDKVTAHAEENGLTYTEVLIAALEEFFGKEERD